VREKYIPYESGSVISHVQPYRDCVLVITSYGAMYCVQWADIAHSFVVTKITEFRND